MGIETTQQALQRWHTMINTRDLKILDQLLAEEVVFRSPVAFTPYSKKNVVFFILSQVIEVFENFHYHREFLTQDGLSAVLEFSAQVDDKQLKGIDMIRFNAQGQIVEFEVMIRPKSGLEALAVRMQQRMATRSIG